MKASDFPPPSNHEVDGIDAPQTLISNPALEKERIKGPKRKRQRKRNQQIQSRFCQVD